MEYIESNITELKLTVNDEVKTEIIAFLNSYLGGVIYVGVNDNGEIIKLSKKEKDLNESKIINWIRDEAIYPNCSEFVDFNYNDDGVLVINVLPGNSKPYYLKEKGPKPNGVYIRYGRNKSHASKEEITRMILESNKIFYENEISDNQKLTFKILKLKFEEKNLNFNEFKMVTSGFVRDGKYTNLAFIFSDQYDIETKIGVYRGLSRAEFKSKKEFNGSIIKQIDFVIDYCNLLNETRIVIDGSPMRKEYDSYHEKAIREAILNCYCHRDYNKRSNIKIEFFDNRCEVISPGGFYGGLTLEDALKGIQSFRNKNLVKLLFKLGYIENYSSGIDRIFKEYEEDLYKPIIETSLNMFKVTFYNLNYDALESKSEVLEIDSDALEIENDALESKSDALEIDSDALEIENDALESKSDALEIDNDALEIESDALEIESDALEIENDALESKSDALEIESDVLEIKDDALEIKDGALEIESDALEIKGDALEIKDDALEIENDALEIESDALEIKSDALEIENDALEIKGDALEIKSDALEIENDALEIENDALEIKGDALEIKSDALEIENDALEIENDALEIESDALEIESDALEIKSDALEIKDDALEIELAIIDLIKNNSKITRKEMTQKIGVSLKTIERVLKNSKIIKRVGSRRYGEWIIKE